MTRIHHTALAAAASLCLLPIAGPAAGADRDIIQARIRYDDLDLARTGGRATLSGRLGAAIARTCGSPISGLRGAVDSARCRREMRADAAEQIAALTATPAVAHAAVH